MEAKKVKGNYKRKLEHKKTTCYANSKRIKKDIKICK